MPTVADCLRQHGPSFLESAAETTPFQVRKVLSALMRCRTGELGNVIYGCRLCSREHWVGRSCGNRHCPTCQHELTQQWLQKQTDRLLPVHYFLVTCTVPQEVRDVIRSYREEGFNAIFDSGAEMLRGCAAESRYLQDAAVPPRTVTNARKSRAVAGSENDLSGNADAAVPVPGFGFFGVLHTWGRDPMQFHPHVHFVVPGGAVSHDRTRWLATPQNFLFVHAKMCSKYKTYFRARMQQLGLLDKIPSSVWKKKWVVDVEPVGNGQTVLKYLAPYVYRVAISDKRILDCTADGVTYAWKPSKSNRWRKRTVTGREFMQGFAQHILPHGFRKVHYYGWCAANSRTTRDMVRWLVWLFLGWTYWLGSGIAPQPERRTPQAPRCSHCGGDLELKGVIDNKGRVLGRRSLPEHATDYLDSG